MYQTHPGPQRDKVAPLAGVGSRSQVSLELSAPDPGPPVDWTNKRAGNAAAGASSVKEDSSPESNLTLESDSSGVFLSPSNQSQEEAGSDSDPPVSGGSDLGSSSTSLEKDDGGLREWGREESAELQWCYPTLLEGPAPRQDGGGDTGGGVADRDNSRLPVLADPGTPPGKKVTLLGGDSPLPLSPAKQPIQRLLDPRQKPIRSSGLDCGDLDPFVQSDSFVYLAVSAGPAPRGEAPPRDGRRDSTQTGPDRRDPESKTAPLAPRAPEEGDFLCTDSFVYLAAPACLLLGPAGTAPYDGRESDSDSSGSEPVDLSVLGCGSVAGDSDWDSDLSDSDPSRSSRTSGARRPKQPPAEPGWDLFGEATEPEALSELFAERDQNGNGGGARKAAAPPSPAGAEPELAAAASTKKVTWQFKPAQRSVCTGSRKEKEATEPGPTRRPPPSSSSSSSSSPSSSSSG